MGKNVIQALRLARRAVMALAFVITPPVNAQPERGTEAGVPEPSSEAAVRERLSRARAAGDASGEAVALEELGNILRFSGQVAEAAEGFQDAARVWARAREPLREFIARHYAGLALTAAGSFSAARTEYETSCSGFERIRAEVNAAECLMNLGTLLGRMGEYRLSETRLSNAIAAAERANRTDLKHNGMNSLANTYLFQGRHREARDKYLELLTDLRAGGKPTSLEGSVLDNLSSSYYRTGQIDDARR